MVVLKACVLSLCHQNNKIQGITVEHISHLTQLETLNLQNNWLSTEGKHLTPSTHPAGAWRTLGRRTLDFPAQLRVFLVTALEFSTVSSKLDLILFQWMNRLLISVGI